MDLSWTIAPMATRERTEPGNGTAVAVAAA